MDASGIVGKIIQVLVEHAEEIAQFFRRPGALVIHINPQNEKEPVKLEIERIKLN